MKTPKKVDCKKHGLTPRVAFTTPNYEVIVCFKCWVEKITKGLTKFK